MQGICGKILPSYLIAQKMFQRWRREKRMASAIQLLGPLQDFKQHLLRAEHGFMQVYLPIHQPPCDKKLLDRIDAFLLHNQLIVDYIKHLYDAIETNHTLGNTCEKAVSA